MSASPYAGIGLALMATSAYNFGLILEKRALEEMPVLDLRRVGRVVLGLTTSVVWLGGFGLMLVGLACQTAVLSFEPVSVVQPVLASGIALVMVLSRVILRERLGGAEFWCVAGMAVAVVLLALSSGGSAPGAGHHADARLMVLVCLPSVIAGLLVAVAPLRASRARRHRMPVSGVCYGIGTGLLYGVAALAIKGLSGVLTGHPGVGAIAGRVVASPYLYLLGGCSVVAMLLFQAALQACRASIVVPVSSVTSSVFFVIAGTLLFHEHLPAGQGKLALRLAGIVVAGVVLVVLSSQTRGGHDAARGRPAPDPGVSHRQAGAAVLRRRRGALQPAAAPGLPDRERRAADAG
jgi:drug/metabolite transporter (DMT)-like permease